MSVESPAKTCPRCSSTISADAPAGLCPRCLMQFVAMSTGGTDFPIDERLPPDLATIRAAFPQLEIIELIGQGGMGAVYKARQTKLDRLIALKILPARLAREPQFAERFEREGKLLARLNHPNIVGVYDFGQVEGLYYLMMEYVDGVNLRQALAASHFTPQQALNVIPKICEALQFAHDEGVLHRDIKPENILLDSKGRLKIADFGIAKFSGLDGKSGLTATGATIGTPYYMAPEQIERPADVDHRADIFSLGVVFYEMLTGELPLGRFAAPSERQESLDSRIDQVVMRALEKDRERRQQSANEVRTEVELLSSSSPGTSPGSSSNPSGIEPVGMTATANPAALATTTTATTTATVENPPVVSKTRKPFEVRPKLALALVCASVLVPIGAALYVGPPSRLSAVHLGMIAAWLGIPGTIIGIAHLQFLGKSGYRHGLLSAVVATTFWPFTIVLGLFYVLAFAVLQGLHQGSSNSVEPLEATVVLVLGLVATVGSVRWIYRWVNRSSPQLGFTAVRPPDSAWRLVLQVMAGGLWILLGLSIVLLFPVGTLERLFVASILLGLAVMGGRSVKRWIEGTAPSATWAVTPKHPVDRAIQLLWKGLAFVVWIGVLVTIVAMMPGSGPPENWAPSGNATPGITTSYAPQLNMDITSLSTNENVLTVEIVDINSTRDREWRAAEELSEPDVDAEVVNNFLTTFRIEFRGPALLPDAVISASQLPNPCFFPGEQSEPITLDLSDGKTVTLAFAFPDAKTAQACKLRIERQMLAGQWPMNMNVDGDRRLLFHVNSVAGEYAVFVEPTR